MKLHSFKNDYSEGAHPRILESLQKDNVSQHNGYGDDESSKAAVRIIREKINNPDAAVHFVSGGTQANLVVISAGLKPYESVISASTGHIAVHEAGAIEATGHKINAIETSDGKLTPRLVQSVLDNHTDEHMVRPGMVFISNSTEVGTIYTQKELQALSDFCRSHELILYLDGARLAAALMSKYNDLTLPELACRVDAFTIGGTKNGALLGEAIVITHEAVQKNFRFHLKQRGALLAKGRILGIQFEELLKGDLYFELGDHANQMASRLAVRIEQLGHAFLVPPATNQIFPIFPNELIEKLQKKYEFYIWKNLDENCSVVRLVTSWATCEQAINRFIADLD